MSLGLKAVRGKVQAPSAKSLQLEANQNNSSVEMKMPFNSKFDYSDKTIETLAATMMKKFWSSRVMRIKYW